MANALRVSLPFLVAINYSSMSGLIEYCPEARRVKRMMEEMGVSEYTNSDLKSQI
jgi:hypothetical protein